MKKIYFLISFCLFAVGYTSAQITITDNDMPKANDTIRLSVTNNLQGIDPVLTGANYLWDYSALVPSSQRIDTFYAVTSMPVAYQYYFNNAIQYAAYKSSYAMNGDDILPQIPMVPISITNVKNFVKKSSSKLENVGFGALVNTFTVPTRKSPIDVEYEFPLDFPDSSFSSSEFAMSLPNIAHYGQIMDRETTVDGWGQLTTPFGSFDVIRVKSVLTKLDTIYLDTLGGGLTFPLPQEIEYKWLANSMGAPILKIVTTAGITTKIEYQDSVRIVGVPDDNIVSGLSIYPNPAKNVIQISFLSVISNKMNWNVKDVSGKIVGSSTFLAQVGKNNLSIDLRKIGVSKGIYFVELQHQKQISSHKIVVIE